MCTCALFLTIIATFCNTTLAARKWRSMSSDRIRLSIIGGSMNQLSRRWSRILFNCREWDKVLVIIDIDLVGIM